jgi:hypothetical protein
VRFLRAILAGIAIHAGLALLERIVPGIGAGIDPFLRPAPALVASLLATVPLSRPEPFRAAWLGAAAGGLTGFLGMIAASLIWLPGGHALPAITSVTGTSVLVGVAAGGLLGLQRARVRIPAPLPEHRAGSYPEARQTR